ncbi:MAG: hypothetical protein H6816_15725 [Phycisphaerales bacterium]|nr:hypothetical protein [Phycisphaerales bacterium]
MKSRAVRRFSVCLPVADSRSFIGCKDVDSGRGYFDVEVVNAFPTNDVSNLDHGNRGRRIAAALVALSSTLAPLATAAADGYAERFFVAARNAGDVATDEDAERVCVTALRAGLLATNDLVESPSVQVATVVSDCLASATSPSWANHCDLAQAQAEVDLLFVVTVERTGGSWWFTVDALRPATASIVWTASEFTGETDSVRAGWDACSAIAAAYLLRFEHVPSVSGESVSPGVTDAAMQQPGGDALSRPSNQLQTVLAVAQVDMASGRYPDAARRYEEAFELAESDASRASAALNAGIAAMANDDAARARAWFNLVGTQFRAEPEWGEAVARRAVLAANEGDVDTQLDALMALVEAGWSDPRILVPGLAAAMPLYEAGRFDDCVQAVQSVDRARAPQDDLVVARVLLLNSLDHLDRLDELLVESEAFLDDYGETASPDGIDLDALLPQVAAARATLLHGDEQVAALRYTVELYEARGSSTDEGAIYAYDGARFALLHEQLSEARARIRDDQSAAAQRPRTMSALDTSLDVVSYALADVYDQAVPMGSARTPEWRACAGLLLLSALEDWEQFIDDLAVPSDATDADRATFLAFRAESATFLSETRELCIDAWVGPALMALPQSDVVAACPEYIQFVASDAASSD